MIQSIFKEPKIRTKVQSYNFPSPVYILAALLINIVIALIWTFLIFKTEKSLEIFIAFTGILNGFVAYLFMHYKNKYKLIFYSIFFSLLTSFLSEYLYFMHYINWEISTVLNKDSFGFSLVFSYFSYMPKGFGNQFIVYLNQSQNFFLYLWLVIVLISPFMYILFDEPEDEVEDELNDSNPEKIESKRLIKRRFDF